MPSSAVATTTPAVTALPDNLPSSSVNGWTKPKPGDDDDRWGTSSAPQQTQHVSSGQQPTSETSDCPWSKAVVVGGQTYTAVASGTEVRISTITLVVGGTRQTLDHGLVASYGNSGVVFQGSTTFILTPAANAPPDCTACYIVSPGYPDGDSRGKSYTVTVNGEKMTAYQLNTGGAITIGTMTLTPGGTASTLASGEILSAATNGLVVQWSSTVSDTVATSTLGPAAQSTHVSATTTNGISRTLAAVTQSSTVPSSAHSSHTLSPLSISAPLSVTASLLLATYLAFLAFS
jgi:hypothetical protein